MIYRMVHNKDNPYFQMNRAALEDERLSWKAVGLLTYLISKPDQWVIRESDLINRHTDGRDAVRTGMRELREAGYVSKVLIRDENNRFSHWEARIYESPELAETSEPWAPGDEEVDEDGLRTDFPASGKSSAREIRRISDTDGLVNKECSKKRARRTSLIPAAQQPGFQIDGTFTPEPTFRERCAEILYNGLATRRKIFSDEPPNLRAWAETFRLFVMRTEVPSTELEVVITWYADYGIDRITTDFVPSAYCAEEFCKKYKKLCDAYGRFMAEREREAKRNGREMSCDPPYVEPVIKLAENPRSQEEIDRFLKDA